MTETPEPMVGRAGAAMVWKAVQMGGVKVIFMLRLLILAWLLSPDDFGLLAIATTAIGFLLQVTDIGMIPALVQGKQVEEKHYDAAWTAGVTRSLGVTLVVILAAPWIASLFAESRATSIIQALALRPLLEAFASIKVARLMKELQFRPLAMLKLAESLVNLLASILLAPSMGVWALVAGTLAGSATTLVLSYVFAPHRPRLSFHWTDIRPLIQFGRWVFLTGVIVMIGNYVFRVVISRQLGTAELGLYFLAAQLAFLPSEVATEIVGTVAFPLFARLQTDLGRAARMFRTAFTGLSLLLFPVCALLIVLAPALVQYILGPKWEGTAPVIQILAVASLLGTLGEVAVPIFNGFGYPARVTLIEVVQSVSLATLVWGLTAQFGLRGAAMAYLPTTGVSLAVCILLIRQILPKAFARLSLPFGCILAGTGLSAMLAWMIGKMIPGLSGFITAGVLAVFIYIAFLWLSDKRLSLGIYEEIQRIFPQFARRMGVRPSVDPVVKPEL
jgi:lipopolysaccharide exporter